MNFFHRNAGFVVEDFITQNDLAYHKKGEHRMKKKTCLLVSFIMTVLLSMNALATTMGVVYAGSGVTITGLDLKFTYTKSETKYWYPEKTASNGMYCAAVVKCTYSKGLFNSYDTCQVTGLPPAGICCFAGVQNLSGGDGMKFTSAVTLQTDGKDTTSTVAKVKHYGSNVKFTIAFGAPE